MRRAPVGMSTGCCIETNLTINFILKKKLVIESLKEIKLLLRVNIFISTQNQESFK